MPAEPPDVSQVREQVAALRRDFDALVEHDKKNMQERAARFEKIEKQVAELAEALKQMEFRLGRFERKNQP